MNEPASPTEAAVEEHVPNFVRIENDLLRCAAGTVLRYAGAHGATVVMLDTGFEVTSTGFAVQRWTYATTADRAHAAAHAAQFVANRLGAGLAAV